MQTMTETLPERAAVRPVGLGRLDYIEGMRGVAAFYVVLTHIASMVDPYRSLQRGFEPSWLGAIFSPLLYGPVAVAAFIVISGFCLQLALFNRQDGRLRDVKGFLKRRCRRIMPPHYICLLFSIVVALTVTQWRYDQLRAAGKGTMPWATYLPVTWENVTAHLTMVQNFSPEWRYKINGVLWSISIEFQLYLLFPLLVWGLWKFGRVGIVGLLSALVFPVLILLPEARQFHLWFLPLFALGMAGAHAAVISKTAPERTRKIVGWAALGLGLLAAFLCTQTNQSWIYDSVGGLSVVLLLVLGAWNPNGPVARFFQLKWLLWMGAFSYSLYLMHHPIMQVLFFYRPSWFTTPVRQTLYLSLFGIPVILILCWLYYLAFEKPFISRKAAQSS